MRELNTTDADEAIAHVVEMFKRALEDYDESDSAGQHALAAVRADNLATFVESQANAIAKLTKLEREPLYKIARRMRASAENHRRHVN